MPISRINSASIANSAISAADIADATITAAKIISVANTQITGNIVSSQITSVGGSQITANTIANSAIQTGAVENYMNAAGLGFGMRNRIINGAMVIDQRNAGASGTASGYNIDRWVFGATLTTKGTWQQNAGSVTPPTGFKNYLGFTSNSAYTPLTGDVFSFYQVIEGFNCADLMWGTADAQTVTVSFWVRSSLTGTFGGALSNTTRSNPFSYIISSANTWEQKTVTVTGDTSGTWNSTNGQGIFLFMTFGAGSTYQGAAGTWATADYRTVTGAVNTVGTNGATWYLTGVQLEKGSTATSFDYRPYGTELQLCQRYYRQVGVGIGAATSTSSLSFNVDHLSMRATPSYTATANLKVTDWYASNPTASTKTININANTSDYGNINSTNFSGLTAGRVFGIQPDTSAIFASSEL
jgi:hypothetical protein